MSMATMDAPLTRAELAGFDKECLEMVLEAQDLGWTGRMGARGHVIMKAPDGVSTISISRKWRNGSGAANMRSHLDRWVRAQAKAEVIDELTQEVQRERFIELVRDTIATDVAKSFGGNDLGETMRAIYLLAMDSVKVQDFVWRLGRDERIGDFGWLSALPADDAEARPWNSNWAVFDRRNGHLVDFGGPRISPDGTPWTEAGVAVLAAEEAARKRRTTGTVTRIEEVTPIEVEMDNRLTIVVDEPERPYKCEHCGRRFKRPVNLGRHQSTMHRDEWLGEAPAEAEANPIGQPEPEPEDEPEADEITADVAVQAMQTMLDHVSTIAQRMAFLESERASYEARLAECQAEYDKSVALLTQERDNALASVSALKQIVADL